MANTADKSAAKTGDMAHSEVHYFNRYYYYPYTY